MDNRTTRKIIKDSYEAEVAICEAVQCGRHKRNEGSCSLRFQGKK